MRYQLIPGVVCADLCGTYLLIAASAAPGHLPYLQEINDQAYFCCRLLQKAVSREEMVREIAASYGISLEEAGQGLRIFLSQLKEAGYIMITDEKPDCSIREWK